MPYASIEGSVGGAVVVVTTPAFCHLLECAEIGEFYLSLTPHTL